MARLFEPSVKVTHHHHFVAEIDLAGISSSASGANLPRMPGKGALFIFMPLDGDMTYGSSKAEVRYWSESVEGTREREPPETLASLTDDDWSQAYHVHQDGMTDGGKVLVRQFAGALLLLTSRTGNLLVTSLRRAEEKDISDRDKARADHEDGVAEALKKARQERPYPQAPEQTMRGEFNDLDKFHNAIPQDFLRFNSSLEPHHLDWSFIFDWSQNFYLNCCNIASDHLQEMVKAGYTHFLLNRRVPQRKKKETMPQPDYLAKAGNLVFV